MPDADVNAIRDPARLATLRGLSRVDTDAVRAFDRLTRIAKTTLMRPPPSSPEAVAIHARARVPVLPKPAGVGDVAELVEKSGAARMADRP